MASPSDDDDDIRTTELETLEAIYPELKRVENPPATGDGLTFELELPVEPASPVTVTFRAASTGNGDQRQLAGTGVPPPPAALIEDSLQVTHLPPLLLHITLPEGYPAQNAPLIKVSATPQWLSVETLSRLADEGRQLWEEMGRDLVAYAYIDHVQRAADDVFGAVTAENTLQVDPEYKLAVLDYDIKAKKAAFEKETFDCGICLDPKKGSKCHKMLDCSHIFCLRCLQDFYNDAIQEGNLSTVRCLAPNCAKERTAAVAAASVNKVKKPKMFINPSELLQIGLSEETVRRYVNLKYKTELESDKNTIYCPRQWCSGAARSKKHKKPSGLDFVETSDNESDQEKDNGLVDEKAKTKKSDKFNLGDLLSVCEDCGFAFCSRCFQSWHGEFFHCTPRRQDGELTEEDKASIEYLKLHTSPCPTCNAPAQKTHGCNHMICSRCDTHFCYLCSAWLDPGNPYQHYNQQPNGRVTSCYMRLWELEGGDGDDVGQGFVGGRGAAINQPVVQDEDGEEVIVIQGFDELAGMEIEEADSTDSEAEDDHIAGAQLEANGHRIAVAREAPLVLRLVDDNNNNNNNNNNQGRGRAAAAAGGRRPPDHQPGQVRRGRGGVAGRGAAPGAHLHGPHARGHHHPAVAPPHAGRARGRDARRARDGGGGRGAAPGGRGGRGGVIAAAGRQNQNQNLRPQAAIAPLDNNVQNRAVNGNGDALDPLQEAWVRHFVRMALIDAEDEVEEDDSDEDNDMWLIR